MTNDLRNGLAFIFAIMAFAISVIAVITGNNDTPTNETSFEVVDQYKECDVVRYAPQQTATYKYFLYCENNK